MDKPDCREGLKTVWGLEIDPSGQIIGTEQQKNDFAEFLQFLTA
jgi:hypothetical protein